ncbi:trypsin-like serine protease, partial [Linderina pennispora]
ILTAGHCLVGATGTVNSPQNITAGYGSNVSEQQTFQTATNVFLHPQYNPSRFENDIGIIQVPDIPLDGVKACALPVYRGWLYPGMPVRSIGWGMTNYTDYYSVSPELKEVVIKVGNPGPMQVPARFDNSNGPRICIENALVPDNGPCSGDSGSPLIAYDGNRPYFAGVMSNGGGAHGEATCAVTGGFAFYTHVLNYLNFIYTVTGRWL